MNSRSSFIIHRSLLSWPVILDILSVGIILLSCASLPIFGYLKARRVEQQLESGRMHLSQAAAAINQKSLAELRLADFEAADQHLLQAESWFRQAQAEVRFFVPLLEIVGGDAGALPHLIDVAVNTTVAGQELYAGVELLLAALLVEPDNPALVNRMDSGRQLVEQLLAGQPYLLKARDHLAIALALRDQIDRTGLSPRMRAAIGEVDEQLPRLYRVANMLAVMPHQLENLLGFQKRKVYLVLSQNNDELRPTGGWIGAYGVVVIEKGELVSIDFYSSYSPALKPPNEACPGENPAWWIQLKEPVWRCFYAQWTADFPTLARQVEWFYEGGRNIHAPIDGVIAMDLIGMETLLAALGPVEVADHNEVIDTQSMRARFYDYRAGSVAGEEELHKKFLASVLQVVIDDLNKLSPEQMVAILKALEQSLREKHLLLYFEDPDLATWAAQLGGDGAINPTANDYLFVVDSSLIGKVYSSVEESLEYEVMINPDGTLMGQITVDWLFRADAVETDPAIAHQFAETGQIPDFANIVRVYVPQGSVWAGTEGNHSPTQFATEEGRLMFGNWVIVPLGERRQIRYRYLTPAKIEQIDGRFYYRLTVQKQPGTRAHPLRIRVVLPKETEFVASTPEANLTYKEGQAMVEFETRLATDQSFEVVFH